MPTTIHPSAVIHPSAQLGAEVQIGPGVVIEGAAQIGDRCVLQAHAIIGAHVTMGADNHIGFSAVIGGDPQDLSFCSDTVSEVRIGARNRIREFSSIHRGTAPGSATVIGDDCYLMAGTHLAHNVQFGNRVITANNALFGGYTHVEDGVFVGGGCVFHQHIRVGRLAVVQGLSAFSKDIPPYTLAAERNTVGGLNVVGLRRAGYGPAQRAEIKEVFDLVYRRGFNVSQALAAAEERAWGEEARRFLEFVGAAKKRGICAFISDRPPEL